MGAVRGASIFQKIITLATALLLGGSVVVVGIAFNLVYNFHFQELDFWNSSFSITPKFICCVGVFTFIVGIYGIIISNSENRVFLSILTVLLCFVVVLQLFSIYYSAKLNFIIINDPPGYAGMEEIVHYQEEGWEWVQPKWDRIQSRLRCCGASESFNTGYQDYMAASVFQARSPFFAAKGQYSVPDTCCKEPHDGCGKGMFSEGNEPAPQIYRDGCMGIMREMLRTEGIRVLEFYKGVVLILALVEIITIIIVVVYIFQIRRKINDPNKYPHSADDDASQKLIKK